VLGFWYRACLSQISGKPETQPVPGIREGEEDGMAKPSAAIIDDRLHEANRLSDSSSRHKVDEPGSTLRELVVLSLDGVAMWQVD
jgi:hypothetical protein